MPSGWVRWMFEQPFQFSTFEVVYPPQLDAGDLKAKYDVIIFTEGIPRRDTERPGAPPSNLPPEWAGKVGTVTVTKTVAQLRKLVEEGGTIIAAGTATNIAYHFNLPVANQLVERTPAGDERPLPSDKYFVPGALVTASVDNTNPLAYGMPDTVDVFFDGSAVFKLEPNAISGGVKVVAWYPKDKPVHSGWGWGQGYLKNGVAALETSLGKGKVFLFCPEITFRGGMHRTFPFLFNGIYYGAAQSVDMAQAGRRSK